MRNRETQATVMKQFFSVAAVCAATSCGSSLVDKVAGSREEAAAIDDRNVVSADDPMAQHEVIVSGESVALMANGRLKEQVRSGQAFDVRSATGQAMFDQMAAESGGLHTSDRAPVGGGDETLDEREDRDATLVLGFPKTLLQKPFLFGGVITKVSDRENEDLGNLKLTDLPAFLVKPTLSRSASGANVLVLRGCSDACTSTSADEDLISLPVSAVTTDKVMIDISETGRGLNLVGILDPNGTSLGFRERSSRATWADFSQDTVVFDVESVMRPIGGNRSDVTFTARWYLRPSSTTHAAFIPRAQTSGVGFFTTTVAAAEKVTRFARPAEGQSTIKYYLKGVPAEYTRDFEAVFTNWNAAFQSYGLDVRLSYEVLVSTDPRNDLIVTGDIRYNVIEWDLVNKATYGGLGPSIGHTLTGENLSANVLIQGPEIIKIYQKWFTASTNARDLRSRGMIADADAVMRDAQVAINQRLANWNRPRSSVGLVTGQGLKFRVPAALPQFQDDARIEFEAWPSNVSFAAYMSGYWLDTVGHEVGHNLGLRHNFRGSLGGSATPTPRKVSRSIMEYLPITHRYLDFTGAYDEMALKYGYMGSAPARRDWFCTDEEKVSPQQLENSAECTTDDADIDAFGYFESKLNKAIDYLVAPGTSAAPSWQVAQMEPQLAKAFNGLLSYAATAQRTSAGWTNWKVGQPERPSDPAIIKTYVLGRVKELICSARIDAAIAEKATAAARDIAKTNVSDLRTSGNKFLQTWGLSAGSPLNCSAR